MYFLFITLFLIYFISYLFWSLSLLQRYNIYFFSEILYTFCHFVISHGLWFYSFQYTYFLFMFYFDETLDFILEELAFKISHCCTLFILFCFWAWCWYLWWYFDASQMLHSMMKYLLIGGASKRDYHSFCQYWFTYW